MLLSTPFFSEIPPPPGNAIEIGGFTVHYYGVLIATGAYLAATWTRRRFVARGEDGAVADRAAVWAIVAGVLGARLAYVATHSGNFEGRPLHAFAVWEGGLAFFGGLFAGGLAAILVLRSGKADVLAFADACTPAIPLAQAIGRWGNYFNQELFGTPAKVPWALEIEPAHRPARYASEATFHPTFLYESLLNLALVMLIIYYDRGAKLKRGALAFVYLAGYGTIRFATELIRTDTTWRLFGISRNGYVAALVAVVGVVGLVIFRRRGTDDLERGEIEGTESAGAV